MVVVSLLTRHIEKSIFGARKIEWGEHPMKYSELLEDRRLHHPAAAEGFYELNGRDEVLARQLWVAEFLGFGADAIIRRVTNLAVAKQVRIITPFRNMATAHGVNTSWTN